MSQLGGGSEFLKFKRQIWNGANGWFAAENDGGTCCPHPVHFLGHVGSLEIDKDASVYKLGFASLSRV